MRNVFLDVLNKSNCLENSVIESPDFFLFQTHFCIHGVFKIKISSKEYGEIAS